MSLAFRYLSILILTFSMPGIKPLHGQAEPVKIGLMLPDRSYHEVLHATEMAVSKANFNGGFNGVPFDLVVRTTEGPWGAGSKEFVSLVFEDSVWAILGSLYGRNAHLAEQVTAKSHIAYLESRATEATLSQAFVPWFFRCVPSDDQQAIAVLERINKTGGGRLAVLCSDNYDSRMATQSFTRIMARSGIAGPEILMINPEKPHFNQFIEQIRKENISNLVITDHAVASIEIMRLLLEQTPGLTVFGTHAFTSGIEMDPPGWNACRGMILISAGNLLTPKGAQFQSDFKDKYGHVPGIPAMYAFDGMNLILEAIMNVGLDQEAIKEYLGDINYAGGSTGSISFDEHGNRTDPVRFVSIRHEKPFLFQE